MMMRVMRHLCPPGILRLAKCADDELQKTFSIDTFYSRIHPSCTIVTKVANAEQHQPFYFVAAVISPNAGFV
jgi:hypothetical protein